MSQPQRQSPGPWVQAALIFGAILAAYFPALRGQLLMDDAGYLTPPQLRSLAGLGRIWTEIGATKQYYPVLHTAFWIEHALWADSLLAYHLFNVLLHATAAWLFVVVLRRLRIPGAYFAGLLFALHPVGVESVAWIAEQKNTLSTVFFLLAAAAYLRFDEHRSSAEKGMRSYGVATALFVLAILSKSVTVTLPAILLIVQWWRRGRLEWRRDVVPLVPWFALGLVDGLVTARVEREVIGARGDHFALSGTARVLIAGRAVWFYLGKLLWPVNLVFIYPRWAVNPVAAWQAVFPLGVVAALAAFWGLRHRSRAPLAAALVFGAALFPTLGFLNVYFFIYSFVADHFQYLAIFSIAALVAAAWGRWADTGGVGPRIAAAAALIILGILTWRQSRIYGDADTLYRSVLASNPDCWLAHNNLGSVWSKLPGRLNDAAAEYQEALRLRPDFAQAHYNLGNARLRQGRIPSAIAELEAALRDDPGYPEAQNDLGNAWSRVPGRLPEAIIHYEAALRLRPDYAEAQSNLGGAELELPERRDEAIARLQQALRLNPDLVEAHYNLGNAWSKIPGRESDAIAQYQAALRLDPADASAHGNLAKSLAQTPERLSEAVAHYEAAIRLSPDVADLHYNLGNALARLPGRLDDAIAQYETALRLDPKNAVIQNNLGNALLRRRGRSEEALLHYQEAVRLSPGYAAAYYNLGNAQAGRPGGLGQAIASYSEALRLAPDLAEAHLNLAIALLKVPGREQEAKIQLEAVLRLQPGNDQVRKILAAMAGR